MKTSMHIALIPAWYEPPEDGHLGIFVRDIAESLANRGHKVVVFALQGRPGSKAEILTRKDPHGFTEYYCFADVKDGFRGYGGMSKAAAECFDQYVRDHGKVDVINTHGLIALNYIKKIRQSHRVNVIHTEHLSSLIPNHIPLLLRWRVRTLYRLADRIVAVSLRLFENLKKMTSTPVIFIPGMLNQSFFQPTMIQQVGGIPELICVGDFDERKGQPMLLEAMALLHLKGIDFRLHLVGDGPLRSVLEQFAHQNDLGQKVVFHGKQTRSYIIQLMSRSCIYCTAVKLENFATHIAEALAMGLFVVTTDSIGPNFYLHSGNSTVVGDYTPTTYAKELMRAVQNQHEINKDKIRMQIALLSSPEVVIPQLESTYQLIQ